MGLRLDGEENVSTVMDREYAEPRRPRSRDHSRKNSHDKNHRIPPQPGPNGTLPIPVDKPLNVIVPNGNDSFENGRYPSSKGGYNHLLDEDFTKKALDAVHGHSSGSTPASSILNSGPSTSSSVQNVAFNTPPRLGGRQEEMYKRRNIGEKIERMRESNKLDTFISQMDLSTPNQVAVNMRRYAKLDNPNFPDGIRNYVLEGTDSPVTSTKTKKNVPSTSKNVKMEDDGDATDYDDLEENDERMPFDPRDPSCSSTAQWLIERSEYLARDAKYAYSIEDTDQQIATLAKKLDDLESADREVMKGIMERHESEEECARLIPYDGTKRRKLVKMDQYLLNSLPSTSRDTNLDNFPTLSLYGEQFLYRGSVMASLHIRKNKSKSIWHNSKELEEEKMRNGVRKKEERDRREKRKMERAEKEEEEEEKSDEYEDTDDEEDEMPLPNHSRKNGAPKEKKRRRDRERKASKKELNKSRRSSDCPPVAVSRLSSVTSRPSIDGEVDYHTPSFNHAHWLEQFRSQMNKNFTYNQIEVPECKRHAIEKLESYRNENLDKYSTESMMRKIASNHHQLEYEERRRFAVHPRGVRQRAQREDSQDSQHNTPRPSEEKEVTEGEVGEGMDTTPSMSLSDPLPVPPPVRKSTTTAPPLPEFDYALVQPVSDYQRLSVEAPYEKRTFPR